MIDHVSIAVRDLARSSALYDRLLTHLGLSRLVSREATVGYGKCYPEFWLNLRAGLVRGSDDPGTHICLRAPSEDAVRAFFDDAVTNGCSSVGDPGPRRGAMTNYFGAFILDPDGNKIEAVNFPARPA